MILTLIAALHSFTVDFVLCSQVAKQAPYLSKYFGFTGLSIRFEVGEAILKVDGYGGRPTGE